MSGKLLGRVFDSAPSQFFFTYKQSQKKIKCKFQQKSQILIFILTYPDSLPIIIYEISGKKHQLDFELNAVLHFNFQNHFYL
jgi:hypothetical protein